MVSLACLIVFRINQLTLLVVTFNRRKVPVHLVSGIIRRTLCAVDAVDPHTTSKRRHVHHVDIHLKGLGATIGPPKLKEGGQPALADVDI